MDLIKIGKFIAECRKAKNLTQLQLAEALYVTDRAVSKWENGRSLPDSSIMLELCKCLDITVNDLLCGEKVNMENYNNEIEANLLQMIKEKEEADKRLLRLEIIFGIFGIITCLSLIMLGSLLNIETWLRIVLIVGGFVFLVPLCLLLIGIEQKAGYYVCPNCGEKYIPTYKRVLFALHINRTRYMKCPKCGKKGWHKKIISKSK